MRASDLLVEVRDKTLTRVAQIRPSDLDLKATVRDCAPGEWTLRLPAEHPSVAALIAPGAGIVVTGPTGVLFSGPTSLPQIEADLTDPDGIATITGTTDDVLLWNRLAYPSPTVADVSAQTAAYDVRTGAAETVMRAYVDANLGPSAPTSRKIALLDLAADLGRGLQVTKSARFDVLGDLLAEIATVASLRFRVVQSGTRLVFEVLPITDRRLTVRFDLRNGTLSSTAISQSPPSVTRAIVAGQGEGVFRTILERTTTDAAAAETAYGAWGRVESFVDQRNTDDTTELQQAGDKILADAAGATSASAVPSDDLSLLFAVDWNVGDAVSAVIDGTENVTTVSAATILVNASGVRVGATFGDMGSASPVSAIDKRVQRAESRLSALERNAESAGIPTGAELPFAGSVAPPGFLLEQGQAVSRSVYADLFALIGTTYGAGNGSTTFNLPDMRKRVPVGLDATDADFTPIGKTGGEKTHTLIVAEMPSHTHIQDPHSHTFSNVLSWPAASYSTDSFTGWGTNNWGAITGVNTTTPTTATNQAAGGGGAHNNLPPYIVRNFIIKT